MEKIKYFIKNEKSILVILAVTFLAFIPSLSGQFLNWDDDIYLLNNPIIRSLSASNLKQILFDYYYGLYNPLTNLSWAIEYFFVEYEPFLYHFNNLILHLINVFLVYTLFKSYIIKNREIALITAFLFAIAPVHVESIAWITERKDVLYTAFYLLSLIFYTKYIVLNKVKYLAIGLLFFVLSILSKGMAASLPILLIAIDYLYNRKLFSVKVIAEKIPFLAISFAMGIANIMAQREFYGIRKDIYSFGEQIAFSSYSFIQYIIKSIIPFKLSAFHPYPETTNNTVPMMYWFYIIPVLLLVGLFVYFIVKKNKKMVFAFSFFVLNVVFVLQLFLHNTEALISERYAYLSSIGLYLIIAFGIDYAKQKDWNYKFVRYAFFAYIFLMAIFTFQQNKVWQDDLSLFTDANKSYPESYIITNNIGNAYLKKGDLQNAADYFSRTIQLNPSHTDAYSNLAGVYSLQGKNDLALKNFNIAIQQKPNNPKLYLNRAKLFIMQKDYSNAIKDCDKVLSINPEHCQAYLVRSISFCYNEELNKARQDYMVIEKSCSDLLPSVREEFTKYINYYNNLGIEHAKKGELKEAIEYFDKALILNPSYTNSLENKAHTEEMLSSQNAKE